MNNNLPPHLVSTGNFLWLFIKVSFQLIWNVILLAFDIIDWIYDNVYQLIIFIKKFLGPVNNAVYKRISEKELFRVVSLAATTGTGVWGFAQVLRENMSEFITDETTLSFARALFNGLEQNYAAVWVVGIVFIGDLFRRTYQSEKIQTPEGQNLLVNTSAPNIIEVENKQ